MTSTAETYVLHIVSPLKATSGSYSEGKRHHDHVYQALG